MSRFKLRLFGRASAFPPPPPPSGITWGTNIYVPQEQALAMGSKTLPGHGIELNYLHPTGNLVMTSATGNGADMFRVNGANQLVRGGQVDNGAGILNWGIAHVDAIGNLAGYIPYTGTLADTYTFTFQCSASGEVSTTTISTTGVITLPAVTVRGYTIPALNVDLANTFSVCEHRFEDTRYPGVANDYYNGNNNFDGHCQSQILVVSWIDKVFGDTILISGGRYNTAQFDTGLGGTAFWDCRPSLPTPTGTFGGTAPEYSDANWVTFAQLDPVNTDWGYFNFTGGGYHKFAHGYWKHTRAQYMRNTGRANQINESAGSSAALAFAGAGDFYAFLKITGSIFDAGIMAGSTTYENDNCSGGIYVSSTDTVNPAHDIIVTDCVFLNGFIPVKITSPNAAPGHDIVYKRNIITGLHTDDCVDIANCYQHDISDCVSIAPPYAGGHPDHYQITMNSTNSGSVPFGSIKRMLMLRGDVGLNGAGLPERGFRVDGDEDAQGLFLDSSGTLVRTDADIRDIIYMGTLANAIGLGNFNGVTIDHVTIIRDQSSGTATYPTIPLYSGTTGVVVTNSILPIDPAAVGLTQSNNYVTPFALDAGGVFPDIFVNPVFGGNLQTILDAQAHYACKAGNSHTSGLGLAGSDIGAIDHTGAWAI